ncbi:MAG: FHA domain-containing protein, partial [Gammaproteobacteria bacterium]
DKDTCKVGRDPSCDIIIQNKFVSRQHAKIILKDGKFLVEDSSFNGTYIEFSNGQKIHVSKDEQALITNGVMSMGKPVDDKSKSVIEFKIRQ